MRRGSDQARLPDFYGIGAPRCGTTAIHAVLKRHPQIFAPIKDLEFWCGDLDSGSKDDGLFFMRDFDEYVSIFSRAPAHQRVGDLSTWYLFSRVAVPRILEANPRALFIVGVRNPVALMESYHAKRLSGLTEDIADLKSALEAEESRRAGHRIPAGARNLAGLQYRQLAAVGAQLQRLAEVAPRAQVHLYVYEDFARDSKSVVDGILDFLGVTRLRWDESVPYVNARLAVNRSALRRAAMNNRAMIYARRLLPRALRSSVRRVLDAATTSPISSSSLTANERRELLMSFQKDIDLTSDFAGRDLWDLWSREASS